MFHVIVIKIYMLEFLKIIKSIFLYFNKTFKDRVKSTESKLRKALNWLKLNVVTECMTKRNMTLSRSYLKVKVIGQTYQPWMCVCVCVCVMTQCIDGSTKDAHFTCTLLTVYLLVVWLSYSLVIAWLMLQHGVCAVIHHSDVLYQCIVSYCGVVAQQVGC